MRQALLLSKCRPYRCNSKFVSPKAISITLTRSSLPFIKSRQLSFTPKWRQQQQPNSLPNPRQGIDREALKADALESIKPETTEKPRKADTGVATSKTDALLSEQTVSNKEQRKADWAIMKEMARYLWPKVEGETSENLKSP